MAAVVVFPDVVAVVVVEPVVVLVVVVVVVVVVVGALGSMESVFWAERVFFAV